MTFIVPRSLRPGKESLNMFSAVPDSRDGSSRKTALQKDAEVTSSIVTQCEKSSQRLESTKPGQSSARKTRHGLPEISEQSC